jgi:hypothetical protein
MSFYIKRNSLPQNKDNAYPFQSVFYDYVDF